MMLFSLRIVKNRSKRYVVFSSKATIKPAIVPYELKFPRIFYQESSECTIWIISGWIKVLHIFVEIFKRFLLFFCRQIFSEYPEMWNNTVLSLSAHIMVLWLPVPVCENEVGGREPLSRRSILLYIRSTVTVHTNRSYVMIRHDLKKRKHNIAKCRTIE